MGTGQQEVKTASAHQQPASAGTQDAQGTNMNDPTLVPRPHETSPERNRSSSMLHCTQVTQAGKSKSELGHATATEQSPTLRGDVSKGQGSKMISLGLHRGETGKAGSVKAMHAFPSTLTPNKTRGGAWDICHIICRQELEAAILHI